MQKAFKPDQWEEKLYSFWEDNGYLQPSDSDSTSQQEPYTILMPPPNANASLHAGHGMYSVDDVVLRWKRLNGFASVWIPGMDHAGFETQFVYEKHLRKKKKSRMDFDRKTLYEDIFEFVQENSGKIYDQFRRLGFLADWDRSVFTLDDHVVEYVYETFQKMVDDGYVYRDEYIVNYCVYDGTSLADLEVVYDERESNLFYIRYPLVEGEFSGKDYIVVATVRPEPIYADTHLAVHPDNDATKELIGRKVRNPMTEEEMEIIADEFVDPEFGTGIVKLTPAHDPHDFKVAKERDLPIVQAIDMRGKMIGGPYEGMKAWMAREKVVEDLKEKDLIEHIDTEYEHSVPTCYKCGRDLEPLTVPNWFIKVDELKSRVTQAVEDDKVRFHPGKYKKQMLQWLDVMHDWPISRQIVWGIQIPVWYDVTEHTDIIMISFIDKDDKGHYGSLKQFLDEGHSFEEIKKGIQELRVPILESGSQKVPWKISTDEPTEKGMWLPETDTFDTWFSSGQWPLVTLREDEFDGPQKRFPTDFMGTLSDILKFWISRMIMFSLYRKDDVPFKHVYLWSMVADKHGKKMSKSKGNVINPIELVDKYGADAFRGALFFGTSQGGKVNLSEDKVKAMRNYANKIWNIGRFIQIGKDAEDAEKVDASEKVEALNKSFASFYAKAQKDMDNFKFTHAFDDIYEYTWHELADIHLEELKDEVRSGNIEVLEALEKIYASCLQLLHPFMPFVTEAIWKEFYGSETSILDTRITDTL